jgi:tRNA threonylcarbamoyl adenosine modification protein (Sua5/YciO/YrdC/YwlC family)
MFKLLNRSKKKPAALLCSDFKQVSEYCYFSDWAFRIAKRIFPGPYTLILKATKQVPRPLQSKRKEVGIRVPNHNVVLQLIEMLETPLLNLTVHDSEGNYFDDPHEIEDTWGKHLGAVVDGDLIPEMPSTVVDMTGDAPEILRIGHGDPDIFM